MKITQEFTDISEKLFKEIHGITGEIDYTFTGELISCQLRDKKFSILRGSNYLIRFHEEVAMTEKRLALCLQLIDAFKKISSDKLLSAFKELFAVFCPKSEGKYELSYSENRWHLNFYHLSIQYQLAITKDRVEPVKIDVEDQERLSIDLTADFMKKALNVMKLL